jgi:hypothetical protein
MLEGVAMNDDEKRALARAVQQACIETALAAYEQAGISGLCQEGRWEVAVGAMRSLDIDALLRNVAGCGGADRRS